MPAVSQQQQKFMGIVRAIQKGDAKAGDFSKKARDAAKKMKKKDVKKFAATKHDDLPKKVKKKESVFAIKGKDIGKGYKIATEPDFIYDPEKKMKKESINEDGHTDVASAERKLKLIIKDAMDTLNALSGLSNEDSLPSWWTDKITLAKDYVGKSRDYITNPVEGFASDAQRKAAFASGYKAKGKKNKKESVNESKKEKDQIIKYLQGLGFDERTAKNAVAKSYNYISKAYRNTGTRYKGDLIARILKKNESVFAVNLDKEKDNERYPEQPNFNYDPEKGKTRIRKTRK